LVSAIGSCSDRAGPGVDHERGVCVIPDTFQLVQIGTVGLVVALVLGLLAIAAGWLAERTLLIAAGVGFLLAATVQLVLLAGGGSGFLGGNASTFSLWLGLGAGLIAIGLVPRPEAIEETSQA
jgi:hypothetical protein